ncbi:hypothetical protein [Pantoea sp. LMR881]|uniref:hypothetical protein n=1 Tax=Pantoea sp. LMR881 TaxID=3014336 RepID=UPI003FA6911C
MEHEYSTAFKTTRYAKLRSETDINVTSFFYHHYSFVNGTSVKSDLTGMIVRPENISHY